MPPADPQIAGRLSGQDVFFEGCDDRGRMACAAHLDDRVVQGGRRAEEVRVGLAPAEGRVRGHADAVREAEAHQGVALEVGVRLDLVRRGRDARVAQQVADQKHVVVAAGERGMEDRLPCQSYNCAWEAAVAYWAKERKSKSGPAKRVSACF